MARTEAIVVVASHTLTQLLEGVDDEPNVPGKAARRLLAELAESAGAVLQQSRLARGTADRLGRITGN